MTLISVICFGICLGIILSILRRGADPLSPARFFGFIWSFAIALAEFKFSALQHVWSLESWFLLLTGLGAFLLGVFIPYVLYLGKPWVPIQTMRQMLRVEEVQERRLFWLIVLSVGVYGVSYIGNYMIKGWLPISVIGTHVSRVDFNVSGLTLFLYSPPYIMFFVVLYFLLVPSRRLKKVILVLLALTVVGSFLLLLQRYQIIMAGMICFTLFYYATPYIRIRTAFPILLGMVGFFYWMSSLRLSHVVTTFMYSASKMRFPKEYAMLTEPYMYLVMNLENFARSVNFAEYHTYGYFTFDFVTAIVGLKYWIIDYFNVDRTPYILSSYNTYTAFWWFFSDFGVAGLALIPLSLGFGTGMLYYRMRCRPTIKNVTAYAVMVFVMFISYFNFPLSLLWFVYNILAFYMILRWTIPPRRFEGNASLIQEPTTGPFVRG